MGLYSRGGGGGGGLLSEGCLPLRFGGLIFEKAYFFLGGGGLLLEFYCRGQNFRKIFKAQIRETVSPRIKSYHLAYKQLSTQAIHISVVQYTKHEKADCHVHLIK